MQGPHPIIGGGVVGGIFGIGEAPDLQPEGGSGDGGTLGAGLVERRLRMHPQQQQGLRCPRCDSPNTKFCYYNNYNLSQPRHYCKSCRRYWTKGGVLRNVPVGGGCRKSKRSSSSSSSSKSSRSSNAKDHDQQHHRRRSTAAAANSRSSSDSSSSITVASVSVTDASDGPLNAEPLPDKLVDANSLTIMKSADEAAPADDAFSVDGAAENLVDGSACSGSADQNQVECFFDYGFSDLSLPGASGMGFMDQTVLHGSDDVDWQLGGLSGNGAGFFDLAGNGGAVDNVGGFWNHGQWAEAVDVDPSLYLP